MISGTILCGNPSLDPKFWHDTYDFDDTPPLPISRYGVCDHLGQLLRACPMLEESQDREFLITGMVIMKEDEPERDGWRWCKWGPYIGDKESKADYLYDEPEIDLVVCYHIYERRTPASEAALRERTFGL